MLIETGASMIMVNSIKNGLPILKSEKDLQPKNVFYLVS